jgi:uncharacterized iron-regulated membrane protein
MFRKILFWSHLTVGVTAALFVAFMAATGSLLAFEPQIMRFFEQRLLESSLTQRSACKTPGQLFFTVQQQTARPVGTMQIFSDPGLPAQVQFGKEEVLFVDPCTGQLLTGAASKVHDFLLAVRNLHASASLEHEEGGLLDEAKNAANLLFFFLILTGLVLWLPRRWRKANFEAVTIFRTSLRGRARDWNWHNVTGFWLAVPLLVIASTGAIMSYSWAEALLYRASGSTMPVRDPRGGENGAKREAGTVDSMRVHDEQPAGEDGKKPASGSDRLDTQDQPRVDEDSEHDDHDEARREDKRKRGDKREHGERRGLARALSSDELLSLDPLVEVAKSKMPGWHNIRMRLSGASARLVTFMFDDGEESEGKGKRSQLLMDRLSGEVLEWTPPDQAPKGQRWRAFARFLHTGEAFGLPGQIVAFIAALATLLLLVTGLALSVRRFFSWKTRTARHNPAGQGCAAQKYPRLRRAFSLSPAQKIEADLSPTTRRESLE